MTSEVKVKLTALSVALAFLLQLIGSVWFLSGLSGAIHIHTEEIASIKEQQRKIEPLLYSFEPLLRDIREIKEDLKELRKK